MNKNTLINRFCDEIHVLHFLILNLCPCHQVKSLAEVYMYMAFLNYHSPAKKNKTKWLTLVFFSLCPIHTSSM